jgi:molybdopterin-guanine dinucleotide biosynthesis protein A
MRETAALHREKPLMLRHDDHWEPLLCVIPVILLPAFKEAWNAGERSPGRIMRNSTQSPCTARITIRGWPI